MDMEIKKKTNEFMRRQCVRGVKRGDFKALQVGEGVKVHGNRSNPGATCACVPRALAL